jgi:hypothetical protein
VRTALASGSRSANGASRGDCDIRASRRAFRCRYLASDEAPRRTWTSPSRRCSSTSAEKSDQLNSVAPLATILNDVAAFRVWRASLNRHCLFADEAAQEVNQGALIIVQIKSFSRSSTRRPHSRQSRRELAHNRAHSFRMARAQVRASVNETGQSELSDMSKKPTAGPMNMQPIERTSIIATPVLPMMPAAGKVKTALHPKQKPTRTDGVRAATAKITRRNSLRKQRAALRD